MIGLDVEHGYRFRFPFRRFLLFLALLLYAMAFQGSRGLWERDEGRYTNIAVQMIRSGNFLDPALNDDVPHFAKPPLTYWAIAAGIKLFGRNEWGVRLANALAFIGTIMVVFALGKMIFPEKPWLPPLVYGSFLLPFGAANFVTTDTLLTFWESLAILGFVRWHSGPEHRRSPLLLMWSGFAMAFLTKGPPGLLPVLGIAGFVALKDGWIELKRLVTPGGLAIFIVLGLGWYMIVVMVNSGLSGYFLRDELIRRVASGATFNRNASWYGAFLVYVPTLIGGTFPWTFVLLRKTRAVPRTLLSRRWLKERLDQDPWLLFLVLWLLMPLCIFWISRSRLPLYLLPLFVPLSLITSKLIGIRPLRRLSICLLVLWLIALVALKWGASKYPYLGDSRRLAWAIAESISPTPSELLFIDTSPCLGLSFYLNCEVEQVLSRPEPRSNQSFEETLDGELAHSEPGTLLVVRSRQKADLVGVLAQLGYSALDVGEIGSWSFISHTDQFNRRQVAMQDGPDLIITCERMNGYLVKPLVKLKSILTTVRRNKGA